MITVRESKVEPIDVDSTEIRLSCDKNCDSESLYRVNQREVLMKNAKEVL